MILLYEMPQKVKNAAVETRGLGERFNADSFLAIIDKLVVALTARQLDLLFRFVVDLRYNKSTT